MTRAIQVLAALYFLERATGQKRHTADRVAEQIAANSSGRSIDAARISSALATAIRTDAVTRTAAQIELSPTGRIAVHRHFIRPALRAMAKTMPGKAKPAARVHAQAGRPTPLGLHVGKPNVVARRIAILRAICASPGITTLDLGRVIEPDAPRPTTVAQVHIETLGTLGLVHRDRVPSAAGTSRSWAMRPTEAGTAAIADEDEAAAAA